MRRPGWRKRRIAELEEQLRQAHENLAVAVVNTGPLHQRMTVEKGAWYRVSYAFRHTGAPYLDLADIFVGLEPPAPAYFDGTTVT